MNGMLIPDDTTLHKLAGDHHRPAYHFLPAMNWMNDPNGLIQWKGVYHIFYQHNPLAAQWGPMHWGHASSLDLLHWKHHPIALEPDQNSADEDGCWSGVAVAHNGSPVIVYSGNSRVGQRCCLATSSDDLHRLQKHAGNPVIPDLPAGYNIAEYRDHCVWREGDTWQQLIGARIKDIGGSVLLYRSQDLIDWQFIQPILVGGQYAVDPLPKNAMWECPDLFALGDQHMLVLSILADGPQHSGYFLGRYADGKFTPHRYHRMDYGDWEYYAPQSFINEAGERIHFGWIQEARNIAWQLEAGWSGLLSLPRTIDLDPAGRVSIQPHRVVAQLRGESYFLDRRELLDGQMYTTSIQGRALELQAVFSMDAPAREVGLRLFCSPAGDEYTEIVYDREKGALSLRRSHASLDSRANRDDRGGELELEPGEDLELRIFIDHSVIEVFANGRAALTGRVYPVRKDSTGIQVFSKGGNGSLAGLNAWRMLPVW